MIASDIITAFETQVDDNTELSGAQELLLLNRKYREVNRAKPWEYTKKSASGTLSTTVPYVSLASDFAFLVANHNNTSESHFAHRPVVFVGPNYDPYYVVSWSDRRQYRTQSNTCYIDYLNKRLVFSVQPVVAYSYEYDYHAQLPALALTDSPAFDSDFHEILVYGMATDDFIQQLSDKAKSYAPENQGKFDAYMQSMAYWNANLVQL